MHYQAESVAIGHPDKLADQISDAILDAYLEQDPKAKVACETMITPDSVILAGEISSHAKVNHKAIVQSVLRPIKSDDFDVDHFKLEERISTQSADIAQAVKLGAG